MRAKAARAAGAHRSDIDADTPLKAPVGRAKAHGGDRPRAERTTRGVVIMDEPTAALSRARDRRPLPHRRAAQGGGPRHPLHLATSSRDLPRSPTAGSCLRDGEKVGEGLIARRDRARTRPPDGRPARSTRSSPSATSPIGDDGAARSRALATRPSSPTSRFTLRQGRDPRPLRPRRRRPLGGHAGAVRPDARRRAGR